MPKTWQRVLPMTHRGCYTVHQPTFLGSRRPSSTRPWRHLVLSYCTVAPLQRVLHAAARLVNGLRPHDHVTSALELHWLSIKQRVDYKLCLLRLFVKRHPTWLACWLQSLRYCHYRLFASRQMATTSFPGPVCNSARWRFLLPRSVHGNGCQQNSSWCVPRQFSSVPWKRSCSGITLSNWTL